MVINNSTASVTSYLTVVAAGNYCAYYNSSVAAVVASVILSISHISSNKISKKLEEKTRMLHVNITINF
jgi:uncharacterized membrane protein